MPDPLNPKLDNDSLYELISQQYPSLTPEQIRHLGNLAGYDLTVPESKPASPQAPSSGQRSTG